MAWTAPVMREWPSTNMNSHALSATRGPVFMFSRMNTPFEGRSREASRHPDHWHSAEDHGTTAILSGLRCLPDGNGVWLTVAGARPASP